MPSINALEREFGSKGLAVLLVSLREARSTVAAAVKARGYTTPVLVDEDGRVAGTYGVRGTPTVFLIGRQGAILGRTIGVRPWDGAEARALLRDLLTPGTPARR